MDQQLMTATVGPLPLVLVGAGGHGREILDIVAAINAADRMGWNVLGVYAETDPGDLLAVHGVTYRGRLEEDQLEEDQGTAAVAGVHYVVGIGNPEARRRIAGVCDTIGWRAATMVHPLALLSTSARVGAGCVLFAHASLSTNVALGDHTHVNLRASLAHDVSVGSCSTIGPAAVVCGGVAIGHNAYVGAAACVLPGVRIGDGAVVGAGAVVVHDVAAGATVKGVPAR
jgi:sugar O-acyltransferase (sialic acid O-acetyltransferase NeuD family)